MQAFLGSQRGWLVVERLPGYAPELNPVEGVWSNLNGQEFADYAADTLDDLTRQARPGHWSGSSPARAVVRLP
jgi:transposase